MKKSMKLAMLAVLAGVVLVPGAVSASGSVTVNAPGKWLPDPLTGPPPPHDYISSVRVHSDHESEWKSDHTINWQDGTGKARTAFFVGESTAWEAKEMTLNITGGLVVDGAAVGIDTTYVGPSLLSGTRSHVKAWDNRVSAVQDAAKPHYAGLKTSNLSVVDVELRNKKDADVYAWLIYNNKMDYKLIGGDGTSEVRGVKLKTDARAQVEIGYRYNPDDTGVGTEVKVREGSNVKLIRGVDLTYDKWLWEPDEAMILLSMDERLDVQNTQVSAADVKVAEDITGVRISETDKAQSQYFQKFVLKNNIVKLQGELSVGKGVYGVHAYHRAYFEGDADNTIGVVDNNDVEIVRVEGNSRINGGVAGALVQNSTVTLTNNDVSIGGGNQLQLGMMSEIDHLAAAGAVLIVDDLSKTLNQVGDVRSGGNSLDLLNVKTAGDVAGGLMKVEPAALGKEFRVDANEAYLERVEGRRAFGGKLTDLGTHDENEIFSVSYNKLVLENSNFEQAIGGDLGVTKGEALVLDNTVTIYSGTIGTVIGGSGIHTGTLASPLAFSVSGNKVEAKPVANGAVVLDAVFGGIASTYADANIVKLAAKEDNSSITVNKLVVGNRGSIAARGGEVDLDNVDAKGNVVGNLGKTAALARVTIANSKVGSALPDDAFAVIGGEATDIAGGKLDGEGNVVKITASEVYGAISGGVAITEGTGHNPLAGFNKVDFDGTAHKSIYGGYVKAMKGGTATAADNTVTLQAGTVEDSVAGGVAFTSDGGQALAQRNTLNLLGGYVMGRVAGGYADNSGGDFSLLTAQNNKVEGNTVNVDDANAFISVNEVIGGISVGMGEVLNNTANWKQDMFEPAPDRPALVAGGMVEGNGNAQGNRVNIDAGVLGSEKSLVVVAGAVGTGAGASLGEMAIGNEDPAKGNVVTMKGGTVHGYVMGGYAAAIEGTSSTGVNGNTADIQNGIVDYVGGGKVKMSENMLQAEANLNHAKVTGSKVRAVNGGYIEGADAGQKVHADGNTVEVTDAETQAVFGGFIESKGTPAAATANDNKVDITGTLTKDAAWQGKDTWVYGGQVYGDSPTVPTEAHRNIVTVAVTKGDFSTIIGGRANKANANEVYVTGATKFNEVYGADAFGENAEAKNNKVEVSAGTGAKVGVISEGLAAENTVTLAGDTVVDTVEVVAKTAARDNVVTIKGNVEVKKTVSLYGDGETKDNQLVLAGGKLDTALLYGYHPDKAHEGNTLKIEKYAGKVGNIANWDVIDFGDMNGLPQVFEVIDGNPTDLAGTDYAFTDTAAMPVDGRTEQVLIHNDALIANVTPKIIDMGSTFARIQMRGADSSADHKDLLYRRINERTEQMDSLTGTMGAALGVLSAGEDGVLRCICELAPVDEEEYGLFAATRFGRTAYDFMADNKVDQKNFVAGIGRKSGDLTYGVFAEKGMGDYKQLTSYGFDSFVADVELDYNGGGIGAHWDGGSYYADAAVRYGKLDIDVKNGLMKGGNSYDYKMDGNYLGARLGFGKLVEVSTGTLDFYGRYYFTKLDGDEFDLDGEHFVIDSINSHRVRVGARYLQAMEGNWDAYSDLAYEYEFDGKAKAHVSGEDFEVDMKGGTFIGEVGGEFTRGDNLNFRLGFSVFGGQRKGYGIDARFTYRF